MQDEIDDWKARDPIAMFRTRVVDSGLASKADVDGVDAEIEDVVNDALEFAKSSAYPDPSTATVNIYSEA